MKYLVIDIGGTYTKYAVMDENLHFYAKEKVPTIKDSLERFIQMLTEIYEANKEEVAGIAISSAGVIDSQRGFMYNAGSVFCVSNVNIVEILSQRCRVPVTVENDAKCVALAEVWKGSLKDNRNAVVIICGTAVGGALICDRQVLQGRNFMAGEFSYILTENEHSMDPQKTLAQIGGVPALIKMAARKKKLSEEELNGEVIFSMANRGDTEIQDCIRRYAHTLAVQITNYQFIFDPEKIVLGGGISIQPLFLKLIQEELKKLNTVYPHAVPLPEVCACRFFNDSNLIGALYVHLKSKEEQISQEHIQELMKYIQGRREEEYLKAFLKNTQKKRS